MSAAGNIQGYVWNKTGYSRGSVATLAQVAQLAAPKVGETVFCLENNRELTYDGELWMCGDFIKCVNDSGATRQQGDVMVIKNSTTGLLPEVVTVTQTGSVYFAGVVAFAAAQSAKVALAFKGVYKSKVVFFSNGYAGSLYEPIRTSSLGGIETFPNAVGIAAGHIGWLIQEPLNGSPQLCWCLLRGKTEYF